MDLKTQYYQSHGIKTLTAVHTKHSNWKKKGAALMLTKQIEKD